MIRLTSAAVACAFVLSAFSPALACAPPPYVEDFRKHPVAVYTGEKKPVDFASHPIAAALSDADKERVRKGVEAGPNFAGAYRVIYAPCGEKCTALLMVSLATGKVTRLPAEDNAFANFRANSNFLVIRTRSGPVSFYLFDGRGFVAAKGSQSES